MAYKSSYSKNIPSGTYRKKKEQQQQQPQIQVSRPKRPQSDYAVRIPQMRPVAGQQSVPRISHTAQTPKTSSPPKIRGVAGPHPKPAVQATKIPAHAAPPQTAPISIKTPSLRDAPSAMKIPTMQQMQQLQQQISLPKISPRITVTSRLGGISLPDPVPINVTQRIKNDQEKVLQMLLARAYRNALDSERENDVLDNKLHKSAQKWVDLYKEQSEKPTLTVEQVEGMDPVLEDKSLVDQLKSHTRSLVSDAWTKFTGENEGFGESSKAGLSNLLYYLATPALLGYAYQGLGGIADESIAKLLRESRNAFIPPEYQGIITFGRVSTIPKTDISGITTGYTNLSKNLIDAYNRALADTLQDIGFGYNRPSNVHNANPSYERQNILQSYFKNYPVDHKTRGAALWADMASKFAQNVVDALPAAIGPVGINKLRLASTARDKIYGSISPKTREFLSDLRQMRQEKNVRIPYTIPPAEPMLSSSVTPFTSKSSNDPIYPAIEDHIATNVTVPKIMEGRPSVMIKLPEQPSQFGERRPNPLPAGTKVEMVKYDDKNNNTGHAEKEPLPSVVGENDTNLKLIDNNDKTSRTIIDDILSGYKSLDDYTEKTKLEKILDYVFAAKFHSADPKKLTEYIGTYGKYTMDESVLQQAYNTAMDNIHKQMTITVPQTVETLNPAATAEQKAEAQRLLNLYYDDMISREKKMNQYTIDKYNTMLMKASQLATAKANMDELTQKSDAQIAAYNSFWNSVKDFVDVYNKYVPVLNTHVGKDIDKVKENMKLSIYANGARLKNLGMADPSEIVYVAKAIGRSFEQYLYNSQSQILGAQRLYNEANSALAALKEHEKTYGSTYPTAKWKDKTKESVEATKKYNELDAKLTEELTKLANKKDKEIGELESLMDTTLKQVRTTVEKPENEYIAIKPIMMQQQTRPMRILKQVSNESENPKTKSKEESKRKDDNTHEIIHEFGLDRFDLLPSVALGTAFIGAGAPIRGAGEINTDPYMRDGQSNILSMRNRNEPSTNAEYLAALTDYFQRHAKRKNYIGDLKDRFLDMRNSLQSWVSNHSANNAGQGYEMQDYNQPLMRYSVHSYGPIVGQEEELITNNSNPLQSTGFKKISEQTKALFDFFEGKQKKKK